MRRIQIKIRCESLALTITPSFGEMASGRGVATWSRIGRPATNNYSPRDYDSHFRRLAKSEFDMGSDAEWYLLPHSIFPREVGLDAVECEAASKCATEIVVAVVSLGKLDSEGRDAYSTYLVVPDDRINRTLALVGESVGRNAVLCLEAEATEFDKRTELFGLAPSEHAFNTDSKILFCHFNGLSVVGDA